MAKARSANDGAGDFVIPDKPSSSARPFLSRPAVGRGGMNSGRGGKSMGFTRPELQHKAVVEPVFLAYNRISTEGSRIALMQVATAVVDALNDPGALDTVQPMKSGWWIYLRTTEDRDRLVANGVNIAGKHIPLRSEFRTARQKMVKITLKDLPLHTIDNSQVLEAVSTICAISSEILYSTLWHEGEPTSIRNGDHFFYVTEHDAECFPDTVDIGDVQAQVFKPRALAKCKRCGNTGHFARDPACVARAPAELAASVEPFRGAMNPLSNLHMCPEGCKIPDSSYDFPLSEHHYQFNRLRHHGLVNESY